MIKFTKAIACVALLSSRVSAFTTLPRHNALVHTTISSGVSTGIDLNQVVDSPSRIQSETRLFSQAESDEPSNDSLLPSAVFIAAAASLAKLAFDINASDLPDSIGTTALLWTSLAVGWDNLIIGLGKPVFGDAETDESQYKILKALSYPRFTAHAVLIPYLYITVADIGKAIGVEVLQGDNITTIMLVVATVVAIASRANFVNGPGIDIADRSKFAPTAVERSLLWFGYIEPKALFVLPAILLSLFNCYVGVNGFQAGNQQAGIYMLISGAAVLYGNAKPSDLKKILAQLGEVIMLWFIYAAALVTMV